MKVGELVMLFSKGGSHVVEVGKNKLHTKDGVVDLVKLRSKKFGDEIKTHLGKKFIIMKPSIIDVLNKKAKRLPQIITAKDIGLILSNTGIGPGSNVVDAGTGSGFLAIVLANYVRPGKVATYEKNKKFAKVAAENIRVSGLSKFIKLKQKDITRGIDERNVDLVALDMQRPDRIVKKAHGALTSGGWLVVYSPYVEQVAMVRKEIAKKNFYFVKTVENIVREWQFEKASRPKTIGMMHTGFLTFARKID